MVNEAIAAELSSSFTFKTTFTDFSMLNSTAVVFRKDWMGFIHYLRGELRHMMNIQTSFFNLRYIEKTGSMYSLLRVDIQSLSRGDRNIFRKNITLLSRRGKIPLSLILN